MIFLFDGDNEYTYGDLFKGLHENNLFYPFYKTKDVFSFFVNLVKGLVSNQSFSLIDGDINLSELNGIDINQINVPCDISPLSFTSLNEVVEAVSKSTSEITIFTSGTTGQPKNVIHNISTLTRSVRIGDRYVGQVWAYAYNPTHMAGLQVFFQAFLNLNSLVNVFNKTRAFIYEQIADKKITHISATPTFYRLLLPFEIEFHSVIRVTLGGEKSEQHIYNSIKKIFPNAKINNVYASTEAGSLFASKGDCFQIPEVLRDKFLVEDEELLIHKSLLGSSESFNYSGDFYKSGDLIEWIDKESGLFKFKSRKNELINIGGYKVNPGEVEKELLAIDGVQQALIYGKANSILGNVLCADVQLIPGYILTELEIKKTLGKKIQDFKVPRRIKFVDEITLTRTGKLKRI